MTPRGYRIVKGILRNQWFVERPCPVPAFPGWPLGWEMVKLARSYRSALAWIRRHRKASR
jgi:hypothetical protein